MRVQDILIGQGKLMDNHSVEYSLPGEAVFFGSPLTQPSTCNVPIPSPIPVLVCKLGQRSWMTCQPTRALCPCWCFKPAHALPVPV